MSSVPSIWRLALKTAKPPRSNILQRVFCGSAPLSAFLWKDIQEWTGTKEVLNSYGITIAAGTSEVQRNILGERVLGMAKSK